MTLCIASDYQSYAGSYIAASGMQVFDPYQSGALKNCSLIAAMASCAWTGKGAWYKSVASEMLAASYSLNFYDYNSAIGPVYPTSKLPQVPKGSLIYAKSTTAGECWPSIIEKGYYMARDKLRQITSDTPDPEYYNDDTRNPTGVPATVLFQLLNTEPKKRSVLLNGTDYAKMIWPDLLSICIGRGSLLKIRYPAIAYSYATSQAPITARHSYSILGLAGTYDATNGWTSKYIVLRDPWAVTTDPGFSSNEMLTSGTWVGGVDFAKKDGIFALRADLFPVYFQGYAYAVI
jgi:hypothetical protein